MVGPRHNRPGEWGKGHQLLLLDKTDYREELYHACSFQDSLKHAPVIIAICGDYSKTARKYGRRAEKYVHMEVGAATENIYLQAEAQELGTVLIAKFFEKEVHRILNLAENLTPLALMPLGKKP